MKSTFMLPSGWVTATEMEESLLQTTQPHKSSHCEFIFPVGCKILIDAAVRLLSLFNQLDHCSCRVLLDFEEGDLGAMGYLNRMGFFDHLSRNVEIKQGWPDFSGAEIHGGTNLGLVEIAKINHQHKDPLLLSRLTSALMQPFTGRSDKDELSDAAWTIFAELIDNIFSHSETPLDGFAALQAYPRGNRIRVAVSDSGRGIMETLRPSLMNELPALARKSDINILVEIFRQGLSRHGQDRGLGLKGCAAKAIKFKADLDVRLPQARVLLAPGIDGYQPNTAYCSENIPLIWGTHICFTFHLDR